MLRASQLVRASATPVARASVHTPSIRFPDRSVKHQAGPPKPHPQAPGDAQQAFDQFEKTRESGPHFDPSRVLSWDQIFNKAPASGSASNSKKDAAASAASASEEGVVEDLHQLPKRYWATPTLEITEAEMEAVNSGGASLV